MGASRRRWLAFLGLVVLAVAVLMGLGVVDRLTRDPPNYSRIDARLYMGGRVAEPPAGTEAVLNLCEAKDPYQASVHCWEPIRDAAPVPTLDWLREQVAFIEDEQAKGRIVYVHCLNGVSRSGLVVVAFYMKRHGWSREQAMAFVRSRRPGLRPNPAFMDLLLQWERALEIPGSRGRVGTEEIRVAHLLTAPQLWQVGRRASK